MNERELDEINILWKSEDPMMATDIVNVGTGLTQSTVTAVLREILNADLVKVVGVTYSGKVLSRTYRPTEKSKEIILQNYVDSYCDFSAIISKTQLLKALFDDNETAVETKQDIKEIKQVSKEFA